VPALPGRPGVAQRRTPEQLGADWFGVIHPVTRFMKGFDLGAIDAVVRDLAQRHGFEVSQADWSSIEETLGRFEYKAIYYGMPLAEGVRHVQARLDLSVAFSHLSPGPEQCARPLRLAVITRGGGFRWIGGQPPDWLTHGKHERSE